MPYVNIRITDEDVSPEQKRELVAGVTQVLVDVLRKDPDTTVVVIDEVPLENWGIGGQPVSEYRARRRAERDAR